MKLSKEAKKKTLKVNCQYYYCHTQSYLGIVKLIIYLSPVYF